VNNEQNSSENYDIRPESFKNYSAYVRNVYINLSKDIIIIDEDKVRNILSEHLKQLERKHLWYTPLGILITISLTFVTASFKRALLSADTWQAIFIIACLISVIWLIWALIKAKKSVTMEDIINEFKKGSQKI